MSVTSTQLLNNETLPKVYFYLRRYVYAERAATKFCLVRLLQIYVY